MRRYTVSVEGKPFELEVSELDADRFNVVVEGKQYEVELRDYEDVSETVITPAMGSAPDAPKRPSRTPDIPTPPIEPTVSPAAINAVPAQGAAVVKAPMPGVIISIDIAEGATVSRGDPLVTLEAMKMRNAIRAPRDGVVTKILVGAGTQVAHGEPLLELGNR